MFTNITKKIQLSSSILLIAILLLTAIVYLPLVFAFFQQDEWFALGHFYSVVQAGPLEMLKVAFYPNIGHFTPFYYVSFYLLTSIFHQNYTAFFLISLLLHLTIVTVVFRLAKKVLNKSVAVLLTSVFFALASSTHQATSWVVADTNTHGATLFGVFSLLAILFGIKSSNFKKYLIISILFVFVSLLFKEVTIGMFLILPLTVYFLGGEKKYFKLSFLVSFLGGCFYVGVRLLMFLVPVAGQSASVITQSQSVGLLFYNMLTFPAKAFIQAFAPTAFWVTVGRFLGKVIPGHPASNTAQFTIFVYERVLEAFFVILFICLVFITKKAYNREKNLRSKVMTWSLLFVAINSIVYAFSPERSGIITFLDSRNLYFTSIGSFIWLTSFLNISSIKSRKLFFVLTLFFLVQGVYFVKDFRQLVSISSIRKVILREVTKEVSTLPSNVVFLVESDTPYYGLPQEKSIPPFQSGFGHTLIVWYSKDKLFPTSFYDANFLWPTDSEGYKYQNGTGFGYFKSYDALARSVQENEVDAENIYAFKWKGETEALVSTTKEIRQRITEQSNNEE